MSAARPLPDVLSAAQASAQRQNAQVFALALALAAHHYGLAAADLRRTCHDRVSQAGRRRQQGRDLAMFILHVMLGWRQCDVMSAFGLGRPGGVFARAMERVLDAEERDPRLAAFISEMDAEFYVPQQGKG